MPLKIVNIVSSANLQCQLDLKEVARKANNIEYNSKWKPVFAKMRLRSPQTTALIYGSGKIICTGAKTVEESRLAARKFARCLQKVGFNVKFTHFRVQNVVATSEVNFGIDLANLYDQHSAYSTYKPSRFPGLTFSARGSRVKALIFKSGKVVLLGGKTKKQLCDGFEEIYPMLVQFKKQETKVSE